MKMRLGSLLGKTWCLLVIGLLILPGLLGLLPFGQPPTDPYVSAEPPPPFGEGDWVINVPTTIQDDSLRIKGNVIINPGASLTLKNTTLLLQMETWYTYKIMAESGAELHILEGSFIGAFAERYAMYAAPGSVFRMRNSTVSGLGAIPIGTRDAVVEDSVILSTYNGLVPWGDDFGGKVVVKRTTFANNNWGFWNVWGDLEVENSTFDSNSEGIHEYPICHAIDDTTELGKWAPTWTKPENKWRRCAGPRTAMVADSEFVYNIYAGVLFWDSEGTLVNNVFRDSQVQALYVMDSDLVLIDNDFINVPYGMYVMTYGTYASNIDLVNNNFMDCHEYAIFYMDSHLLSGSWTVTDDVYIDSDMRTRTPFTVKAGGKLVLDDISFGFLPLASEPLGIMVEDGGEVLLNHTTMAPVGDLGVQLYLRAGQGSKVTIRNSTIRHVGYSWGTDGELAGVYSEGQLLVEDSTIRDGMYGIVTNNGDHVVRNTDIFNGSHALRGGPGNLKVYDSRLWDESIYDISVDGGTVDLYNTTFDKGRYIVDSGTMNVHWSCDLLTMWQNREPVANVSYNISEKQGVLVASGATGPDGISDRFWLREFTDTGNGAEATTPHQMTGTVLGITNTTTGNVRDNTRLELFVEDGIAPAINVTSPGLVVHQMNNTLVVNGTASDGESGLDRVQWSFDQDYWNDVNGTEEWNFTIVLRYGTTVIFVRALDQAGNDKVLRMVVTIDKDAPYLVVLSPRDGFVTSLRTVLVKGFAETGSTVTVAGLSVVSLDGTFRLSAPLQEGENVLQIVATDATGNTNSTTVTVYSDTTPPVIIIESPPVDLVTNDPMDVNILVQGQTEAGALFQIDGRNVPLGPNGTFSFTVGLEEGLNVINFLVRDAVGNQNTTIRRVMYDLTIPDLKLYTPEDGAYTNLTTTTVTGLSEAGAILTAVNGNLTATVTADREGRFDIEMELVEGENTILVTARDEATNSRQRTVRVIRDTTAPDIVLFYVHDGKVMETNWVLLEGETEVGAKVKINGELVSVGYSGRFSLRMDLPSANNTILVDVVDMAGNRNQSVTHLLRTPEAEPPPPVTSLRPDHFPWFVVLAIALLVVQWALLFRYSMKDASKKGPNGLEGKGAKRYPRRPKDRDEEEYEEEHEEEYEEKGKRVRPKRGPGGGRPRAPGSQGAQRADAGEFEIEYGEDHPYGGGRG